MLLSTTPPVVVSNPDLFDIVRQIYVQPLFNSGCISFELKDLEGKVILRSQNFVGERSDFSLQFGTTNVGTLSLTTDPRRPVDSSQATAVALQLAALCAWTSPWPQKIQALEILWALKAANPTFDWIGIYRRSKNTEMLTVSAYIGEPTEHIHIPLDQGICGAAIRENKLLNIPDVRADSRFIACSIRTRSELVIPIHNKRGEAIAEIDIDSNTPNAFTTEHERIVRLACERLGSIDGLFD